MLGSTFYDRDAYNFDQATGEITRNENYKGINALFELPLDKSKADEAKAEKLLAKWKKGDNGNAETKENTKDTEDEMDWANVKKNCKLIKGSVKTYPASQYGKMLSYSLDETGNSNTEENVWSIAIDAYFKENEYGIKVAGAASNSEGTVYVVVKRSQNGEITVSQYQ